MEEMKALVAIQAREIDGTSVNTVDARDLHEKLGVGKVFRAWIKDRIEQCDLVQGVDYITLSNSGHRLVSEGGANKIDYYFTLDSAKHLCMMERNNQGKMVRQYFIDFEKKARDILPKKTFEEMTLEVLTGLKDKVDKQRRLIEGQKKELDFQVQYIGLQDQEIDTKQKEIEVLKPKAEIWDAVTYTNGSMSMGKAAKLLSSEGFKIGRNRLISKLRDDWHWLMGTNEAKQHFVEKGYFRMSVYTHTNGVAYPITMVCMKGLEAIRDRLIRERNRSTVLANVASRKAK
jgi:phage anti-repressor protein/phage antirepressor YoqD-like protein